MEQVDLRFLEKAVLRVQAEGLRLEASLPAFHGAVAQIDCRANGLFLRLKAPGAAVRQRLEVCAQKLEQRLKPRLPVSLNCEVSA